MRFLSAFLSVTLGMCVALSSASAEESKPAAKGTDTPAKKTATKKPTSKKKAAAAAAAAGAGTAAAAGAAAAVDEDDITPDVGSSVAVDFSCELNNKVTIYRNVDDNAHIALRWKKQLLRLKRVETTTGANRFENRKNGWVWIDIPAKGMLLDAKRGQQLANECRNPEQMQTKPITEASNS